MNAIAAGAVDTDIRAHGTTPEIEASIVASVPLGRQASVDDVTALFAFLASEEAGLHHRHHAEPQRRLLHLLTATPRTDRAARHSSTARRNTQ